VARLAARLGAMVGLRPSGPTAQLREAMEPLVLVVAVVVRAAAVTSTCMGVLDCRGEQMRTGPTVTAVVTTALLCQVRWAGSQEAGEPVLLGLAAATTAPQVP